MRVGIVAILLLFAGCAAPADSPDVDPPVAAPAAIPEAYGLLCPPGGEDIDGVCAYRITSLTETNQEPFVAVHPHDPDIVAVGVNAGHTTEGVSQHGERPGFDRVRLDIFITTDGGQTWERSTLPYVADPDVTFEPVETSVIGDPALEFDQNGTLHVSGIASHSQLRGYNVFYTQSPDMGATWTTPRVLSTGDSNDRNWLNLGPDGTIYVPWQEVGGPSWVAWSPDGDDWKTAEVPDCFTISEVAFLDGEVLFACTKRVEGDYSVVVWKLAGMEKLAEGVLPCVWPKLNNANGTLFLTGEACNGSRFATSADGRNWTTPGDLSAIAAGSVMWQTDDVWGRMHLLMAEAGSKAYVVYDVEKEAVLQRTPLPSEPEQSAPETIAPSYGDHYWGIDVTLEGGAIVWTRADNLDLSFLEPVFPE